MSLKFFAKQKILDEKNGIEYDEKLFLQTPIEKLPITRVYSWNKPTITFGYFQNPEKIISLSVCQKLGIPIIRRITGGGIILHDQDLSYSLVYPRNYFAKNMKVKEIYRKLTDFLFHFYKEIGLDNLSYSSDLEEKSQNTSLICYQSIESNDFIINKKKIGGCAMRINKEKILIQGTIPITINYDLYQEVYGISNKIKLNFMSVRELGVDYTFEELKYLLEEMIAVKI